jgi:anti-sigma factor RsiW
MLSLAHRRYTRSVGPYADGELDASAAWFLRAHLRECEDCSHDLAMVLAIKGSLRRLAAIEPHTLSATRLRRRAAHLAE